VRRRDFIKVIAGAAVSSPLAARAQQPVLPVIGFVNSAPRQGFEPQVAAFLKGLGEAGYVDGRNVTIEYRWAEGQYDRLPVMVADLVQRQVAVIVANTPGNLVAKAATKSIPIVFTTAGDPVKLGLVASLDRPGGNVTGATQLNLEIIPKRLQLLHELIPNASVFALLVNPANPTLAETNTKGLQAAARDLGLELQVLNASTEGDFDAVFAKLVELRAGGLVIGDDPFFVGHIKQLAALSVRHGLPAAHDLREFVAPAA